MIDNIFGIFDIKMQSKIKGKVKKQNNNKVMEIDMMRIDPGAIGFTSGFSQDSISILRWVNKLLLSN